MITTSVVANGIAYEVVSDLPVERRAVIVALLRDEITNKAPRGEVTATTNRDAAIARAGTGGAFAISGRLEHLFPDPVPYTLELTIAARGYRTFVSPPIPIPANPVFPIDRGTILLRPLPVRVEGRVTRESNRLPIANATIRILTPKLVLLRTPAYLDYPVATPVNVTTFGPPGAATTLDAFAAAGTRTFTVAALGPIVAGDVLLFGGSEYGIVAATDAFANKITLTHALRHSYPSGTSVEIQTPGAGAGTTLARDTNAGDGVLVLNASLLGDAISIGGPASEYHTLHTVSNAAGFFGMDGITGAREIEFRASAATFLDQDVKRTIDYSDAVNTLSFRLRT